MCISEIGAFPKLAFRLFTVFGFALYGQQPAFNDSIDSWFPGPASSTPIPYFSPTPNAPDDFPFAAENAPESKGTITAAELQHPLSSKARSLLLKAQTAMHAGNFDECFRDLDNAMKIKSAAPYVHGIRGAADLLRGLIPEAISELQQAVQVLPIPANYSNLAYGHLLTGDVELGEQELRRAIEFHSPVPQARYLLGLLLLDRKPRNTEACEHLQQAQELMPVVHMALAVCYTRDGREVAADGQIRQVLGPANEIKFDFWKRWVSLVATQPKPSTAFGLRIQQKSKTQQ
jgi:Flp pilus assembly protein TadD